MCVCVAFMSIEHCTHLIFERICSSQLVVLKYIYISVALKLITSAAHHFTFHYYYVYVIYKKKEEKNSLVFLTFFSSLFYFSFHFLVVRIRKILKSFFASTRFPTPWLYIYSIYVDFLYVQWLHIARVYIDVDTS